MFVGVYEPTKQKLLRMFPENLSAVAHLVRGPFTLFGCMINSIVCA